MLQECLLIHGAMQGQGGTYLRVSCPIGSTTISPFRLQSACISRNSYTILLFDEIHRCIVLSYLALTVLIRSVGLNGHRMSISGVIHELVYVEIPKVYSMDYDRP